MRYALSAASICLALAQAAGAQEVRTVADAVRTLPPKKTATSDAPVPAMPASDPGTWVRTEDYPAWAVRYDVSGRVGFTLEVGADGRVAGCEVTRSSGVPDLDAIACQKVTERARFTPARNQFGEPVRGSWATSVVWQFPDDGLNEAPKPSFLVVTMIVEPDGTVSDCQVERAEGQAAGLPLDECGENQRFEPILGSDGNPQRTRVRIMTRLVHEPLP